MPEWKVACKSPVLVLVFPNLDEPGAIPAQPKLERVAQNFFFAFFYFKLWLKPAQQIH